MSPSAARVERSGGVTDLTDHDYELQRTTGWLSADTEFEGVGGGVLSIGDVDTTGGKQWDWRPASADGWQRLVSRVTLGADRWEPDEDIRGLTIGSGTELGVLGEEAQADVGTLVMCIPTWGTRNVIRRATPEESTWLYSTHEGIAALEKQVGMPDWSAGGSGVFLSGSLGTNAVIRLGRNYDVTYGPAFLDENRITTDSLFGSWNRASVGATLSSVAKSASGFEPALAAVAERVEAVTQPLVGPRTRSQERVLARLGQLRSAPQSEQPPWVERPEDRAFADAEEFVTAWRPVEIQMPDVGLADDGEVNFLWKGPELHVDLGFYGDGTFSYFARDGDGVRYADDDVVAGLGLPPDLLALLKA